MTEHTMIDEDDGTQTEETETALEPAVSDATESGTEQTDDTAEKPETHEEEHAKRAPWFQKRIDELTREKWEARREADAAKALAETLRQRQPDDQPKQEIPDLDRLVTERATQLRDAEAFNEACNATYQKGLKDIPNFAQAVEGYQLLGGLADKRDFLEAINALPNGPQLYHHLGVNLDEGQRVLSLPPVKMTLELNKLSQKLAAPKPVSKAPDPITPIGGSSVNDGDPEKMSMADWIKWREKQLKK
jgi:hypothetical protein